jgi:hypothetical protein
LAVVSALCADSLKPTIRLASKIYTLDFTIRRGEILNMIAVETNDHEIRVNIPTDGMPAEAVARRSRLTDDAAWKLAEDVKSDWWAKNQSRFTSERK